MSERERLERALRALRAPDEARTAERSREVVRRALVRGERPRPRRPRARFAALLTALALAATGLALTPAGASIREWIADTVGIGDGVTERAALRDLPGGGSLLVRSPAGMWTVGDSGTRRRIGAYREAIWSPSGLFVGAARGRQLVALEPDGDVRWALSTPGRVSDPRWAPSGVRIAYRSGDDLRVVWGDGANDRLIARNVAATAPVWRPASAPGPGRPQANVLAYVTGGGELVAVDVDNGKQVWRANTAVRPSALLEWLADGRVAIGEPQGIAVLSPAGRLRLAESNPRGMQTTAIAASPSGRRIAVLRTFGGSAASKPDAPRSRSELVLIRVEARELVRRNLFSGPGEFASVAFSPDGEWLLLSWIDADQWLFVRPTPHRKLIERVTAVGDISRQFDPGGRGAAAFPRIEDWCCR